MGRRPLVRLPVLLLSGGCSSASCSARSAATCRPGALAAPHLRALLLHTCLHPLAMASLIPRAALAHLLVHRRRAATRDCCCLPAHAPASATLEAGQADVRLPDPLRRRQQTAAQLSACQLALAHHRVGGVCAATRTPATAAATAAGVAASAAAARPLRLRAAAAAVLLVLPLLVLLLLLHLLVHLCFCFCLYPPTSSSHLARP